MSPFMIFFVVSLALGASCVIIGITGLLSKRAADREKAAALGSSVADADSAIDELNDVSQAVFKQMDDKYQELLYIYNLIDEKKNELLNLDSGAKPVRQANKPRQSRSAAGFAKEQSAALAKRPGIKSKRYDEISALLHKGLSIADIAKTLNIGKGEVQLILDLGRVR